jgi:heavy metal efflux system protein
LVFGMILVFFVQWIFLGDLRSALIVSSTIPFALFFAMSILVLRGESADLLSVGAIDFGLIVDATVIMVENIFRHLAEGAPLNGAAETAAPAGLRGKLATIFRAATEVNRAIFFSAAIIIVGFIPLFTLSGVEGHIFSPMAKTYAYALAGALIATFTVVPAFSAYLLHDRVRETETIIVSILRRIYTPLVEFAVAHRLLALAATGLLYQIPLIRTRGPIGAVRWT